MAVTTFENLDELFRSISKNLGTSERIVVGEERVRAFEASVGRDPTIAVGVVPPFLLLSVTNELLPLVVEIKNFSSGVNYGTGEVRFPFPLSIGASVSGTVTLMSAESVTAGVQTVMRIHVVDEAGSCVCVVDAIGRYFY